MRLSQNAVIGAFSLLLLNACGGGSSDESNNDTGGGNTPAPESVSLDSFSDVELTENNSTSVNVSWTGDFSGDIVVEQVSGPELGLELNEDNTFTVTAPEVSSNKEMAISVSLTEGGSEVDSQTLNINVLNDSSHLYAPGYDDYSVHENATTETDKWRVAEIGVLSIDIVQEEDGRVNCYPGPDDCSTIETFLPDFGDNVRGDFNGDGRDDLAVSLTYNPHRAKRDLERLPGTVLIFENTEEHGLVLNNDIIQNHSELVRHQPYRMAVADFNKDGFDDLVVSGTAVPATAEEQANGQLFANEERPIVLLSNGEGQLIDASDDVDITLGEGSTGFGHNLAVGDINKDGWTDFFVGMSVVLNNGDGTFTERSDRHFTDNAQWSSPLASAMGDMNGDGLTDLALLDYTPLDFVTSIVHSQIIISNNTGDSLNQNNSPQLVTLPEGRWGNDITHVNYALMADVLDEHPGDELIIAETRLDKYYDGRWLRLFALDSEGNLVEETERLINNEKRLGQRADSDGAGEGVTYVLDFNKDGLPDIVDITGGEQNCDDLALCSQGLAVFYNDGNGQFVYQRFDDIPYLIYNDFEGYNDGSPRSRSLSEAIPFDSGNPLGYDLLTQFGTLPQEYLQQGDQQQMTGYILQPKENGL